MLPSTVPPLVWLCAYASNRPPAGGKAESCTDRSVEESYADGCAGGMGIGEEPEISVLGVFSYYLVLGIIREEVYSLTFSDESNPPVRQLLCI